MADQQFCLRWNNHQSTLISVFDSLQERGCMVDCTLAAEGQSLQAHKVVLSACSPYLEDLLSKHYDKHPILLLKDVKFEELKAMLDYMYRGEVNIAQDKLATFLRAAESLQIKGLSDGGTEPPDTGGTTGATKRTSKGAPVTVRSTQQLTVRPTNSTAEDNASRDGSVSPSLRKRRRRRGSENSDNDSSGHVPEAKPSAAPGSSNSNQDTLPAVPLSGPTEASLLLSSILESPETDNVTDSGLASATNSVHTPHENNVIRDKDSTDLIQPKTEYLDDDVQDVTLEEDGEMFRAGPSHARGSASFMGDGGDDMYSQDSSGAANAQGDFFLQGLKSEINSQMDALK